MSFIQEFKHFALKGNVVDLAVGVIIGGAFNNIVNSVINDLITPIIGKIVGNVDFSNIYIALSNKIEPGLALADAKKIGPVFAYGSFLTVLLNFLIQALCIFLIVKLINTARHAFHEEQKAAAAAAPPPPTDEVVVLTEIRDLLKRAK